MTELLRPTTPPPITRVLDRLGSIEARLNRMLAAGWRNAADDLAELGEDADAPAALGLVELAERLRAVAAAPDPGEGVLAAATALAGSRLVRVRLATDEPAPGRWKPIGGTGKAANEVLPLARFALADGEVWSCLWLKGGFVSQWVLVEPPRLPPAMPGDLAPGSPWLLRSVRGRLHWRRRLPLGAAGEVQVCVLEDAAWVQSDGPNQGALFLLLDALGKGTLDERTWLASNVVKVVPFDPHDLDAYAWPDPAAPAALAAGAARLNKVWALASTASGVTPLALLTTADTGAKLGLAKLAPALRPKPRLIHLVPGLSSEELPGP